MDLVARAPLIPGPDLVLYRDLRGVDLWARAPLVPGPDLVLYRDGPTATTYAVETLFATVAIGEAPSIFATSATIGLIATVAIGEAPSIFATSATIVGSARPNKGFFLFNTGKKQRRARKAEPSRADPVEETRLVHIFARVAIGEAPPIVTISTSLALTSVVATSGRDYPPETAAILGGSALVAQIGTLERFDSAARISTFADVLADLSIARTRADSLSAELAAIEWIDAELLES